MLLAANIKKLRQKSGMSQDKLSNLAGITLNTLTKIESGATLDPGILTVKKIASALGCDIDELLEPKN